MNKNNSLKGFTLLELLVVIVVIGVLAGLLLPVMSGVREQGRRITCLNNLRQQGIAWYMYLDEHNDCFPAYSDPPNDTQCMETTFGGKAGDSGFAATSRPLNRYLGINNTTPADVFHCPDDIKAAQGQSRTVFDVFGNSYYINPCILLYGVTDRRPLASITNPRNKVWFEMCSLDMVPGHSGKGFQGNFTPVMVLFVDGHVKGPYLSDSEFDWFDNPSKSVCWYPNATEDPLD